MRLLGGSKFFCEHTTARPVVMRLGCQAAPRAAALSLRTRPTRAHASMGFRVIRQPRPLPARPEQGFDLGVVQGGIQADRNEIPEEGGQGREAQAGCVRRLLDDRALQQGAFGPAGVRLGCVAEWTLGGSVSPRDGTGPRRPGDGGVGEESGCGDRPSPANLGPGSSRAIPEEVRVLPPNAR